MTKEILTVSALNNRIKDLLEEGLEKLWVEGEVSNLRRPASGHIYFTLKDDRSQIRSVIFRSPFAMKTARPNGTAFDLEEGMSVVCLARVGVYAPRGEYQLVIDRLEPKGVGALQMAFEQLKARLEKEGLFDVVHKKKIPFLPARIGVITSPTGAVIRDILTITRRRFPTVDIRVAAVRVQGGEAAAEIIQAIDDLKACGDIDLIILARGGGSLEDLAPFNDEGLARAIFRSRIPVISAVGHETDFTIADFVADLRAPTPSAAAELAVPIRRDLLASLENLRHRMHLAQRRAAGRARERLTLAGERLKDPKRRLSDLRLRTDERLERLLWMFRRFQEKRKQELAGTASRLHRVCPLIRIRDHQSTLDHQWGNMIAGIGNTLERFNNRLNTRRAMLDGLSPLAVLKRGYGIVRRLPDGRIIRRSEDLFAGAQVRVRVSSGSFEATVDQVSEE